MWNLRDHAAPANQHFGYVFKYDVSLDVRKMNELIEILREKTKHLGKAVGYGHIGDFNLHIDVTVYNDKDIPEMERILEPFLF